MAKKSRDRDEFIKAFSECKQISDKYKLETGIELNRGSNGVIYAACKTSCNKIIKILKNANEEMFQNEVKIFELLNKSNLTPILYDAVSCGLYDFLVLQRFPAANVQNMATRRFSDNLKAIDVITPSSGLYPQLYKETDIIEMFRIAFELSDKYDIIHGDLKPDQYLYAEANTGRLVVTDFGFSGTSDGKMQAFRGWSRLRSCGSWQYLPPTTDPKEVALYKKYFNAYQLWTYLAFREQATPVLLNDRKHFRYLASQYYPFAEGHPWHIPYTVLIHFLAQENRTKYDNPANPHSPPPKQECLGKALPTWTTKSAPGNIYPLIIKLPPPVASLPPLLKLPPPPAPAPAPAPMCNDIVRLPKYDVIKREGEYELRRQSNRNIFYKNGQVIAKKDVPSSIRDAFLLVYQQCYLNRH